MKDHDTLVPSKDGKTWDLQKRGADAPLPHADGCVGCRRASTCVSCNAFAELGNGRCVSGMCTVCCALLHGEHRVTYKLIVYPTPAPP